MGPLFWLPTRGRGSEVRSSSGPPAPTPTVAGWFAYYFADLLDLGALASCPDTGGTNGQPLIQVSGPGQPIVTANVFNGKNAIVFGSNQNMGVASWAVTQPSTIFTVFTPASGGTLYDSTTSGQRQTVFAVSSVLSMFAGSSLGSAAVASSPTIMTNSFNGGSSILRINGVKTATGNAGGESQSGLVVGNNLTFNSQFLGPLATFLVYNSGLTDAQCQSIQAWLGSSSRYSIALGQPQISTVDFTGLSGANFVTASTGKYFVVYYPSGGSIPYGFWFSTGTESQPTDTGVSYIPISISPTSTAAQIASAIASQAPSQVSGNLTFSASGNQVSISTTPVGGLYSSTTNAADVSTGAAVSTTQAGTGNN